MIVLFYLAYIAVGMLITLLISQKSHTGAQIFVVVFSAWPIFEIFVLPTVVLRMNCDLAGAKIYKTVSTDSFYTDRLSESEMVNMILDEQYREIQTYLNRKPDGTYSIAGYWVALQKVDAVSKACNVGRKVIGPDVLRGGQCVGVVPIRGVTADYSYKKSDSFLKQTFGFRVNYSGRAYKNRKTDEVLAEERNIWVDNVSWPISRFAEDQFGISHSGTCRAPKIDVSEAFLQQRD